MAEMAVSVKQPMQPLFIDEHGVVRFKSNGLVRYLLENGGIDLNHLARIDFPQQDKEQFAQLIGYSLGGFGELSYVSDKTYSKAIRLKNKMAEMNADPSKATAI